MVLLQRSYIILRSTQIHKFQIDDYKCELEKERCNTFGVKHPSPGRTQGALAVAPDPGLRYETPLA